MSETYHSKKETNLYTIAFYNLENLFDVVNDPHTLDHAFSPTSEKKWNMKRYQKKLDKLGTAISNIGFLGSSKAPILVGVAEAENLKVLQDLISTPHLKNKNYGIVHYDSPDERGIDVALLYQKEYFELLDAQPISVMITDDKGVRDMTRDILWVTGKLNGEKMHLLVNHWPSRRDGAHLTAYKRIIVAEKNREIISEITTEDPNAKIIIMGDFNDDPKSDSIKKHLVKDDFFNPMEKLHTRYSGSSSYKSAWNLFDQIIFSHNFHQYKKQTHSFAFSKVFGDDFLKIQKGRYKGKPFRTYAGKKYLGGYSDHFPVYIQLKYNK